MPKARHFVFGPVLPDWCTPLDEPRWIKPSDATLMRDDDAVLGFEAVGQQWAIPWWVMKNHHVANLTLDREEVLVTLCERCGGGGVYDPIVDGRRLRFHANGVYDGTPIMQDDATGSLWRVVNTQVLDGPALEIGRLPKRPIVHCTWSEWRAMYPETWIADGEGEPRDGHGAPYPNPDHQDGSSMGKRFAPYDSRLEGTDLVVGLELGGMSRAYPLAAVHERGGIVEDVLAGRPVVVVTRPGTWLATAFEREVGGTLVALRWPGSEDPPVHLLDGSTGSRFDIWGRCVAGALEGSRLPYVVSALRKWVVWTVTNAGSEIWRAA